MAVLEANVASRGRRNDLRLAGRICRGPNRPTAQDAGNGRPPQDRCRVEWWRSTTARVLIFISPQIVRKKSANAP
jgi:hypothetical protein